MSSNENFNRRDFLKIIGELSILLKAEVNEGMGRKLKVIRYNIPLDENYPSLKFIKEYKSALNMSFVKSVLLIEPYCSCMK